MKSSTKNSQTEYCTRKERSGIPSLLAGRWKLKGIRKKIDEGRWLFCWNEEDIKGIY